MTIVRAVKHAAIAFGFALLAASPLSAVAADRPVTVFAAASLKDVLSTIAADWKADTAKDTTLSFAASSALAKQITQAAPADIFISADLKWMDYVAKARLIEEGTRVDLLGNRIVLIEPASGKTDTEIKAGFPLATLLGDGKLAMANTDSVPAGVYGKAALEKLGVWDGVKDKVAQAENVRAALLFVSRAEAPFGIVYETDARVDANVRIVGAFPDDSHEPIVYPAALIASSTNPDAKAFLDYLSSDKASAVFKAAGFTVLSAK